MILIFHRSILNYALLLGIIMCLIHIPIAVATNQWVCQDTAIPLQIYQELPTGKYRGGRNQPNQFPIDSGSITIPLNEQIFTDILDGGVVLMNFISSFQTFSQYPLQSLPIFTYTGIRPILGANAVITIFVEISGSNTSYSIDVKPNVGSIVFNISLDLLLSPTFNQDNSIHYHLAKSIDELLLYDITEADADAKCPELQQNGQIIAIAPMLNNGVLEGNEQCDIYIQPSSSFNLVACENGVYKPDWSSGTHCENTACTLAHETRFCQYEDVEMTNTKPCYAYSFVPLPAEEDLCTFAAACEEHHLQWIYPEHSNNSGGGSQQFYTPENVLRQRASACVHPEYASPLQCYDEGYMTPPSTLTPVCALVGTIDSNIRYLEVPHDLCSPPPVLYCNIQQYKAAWALSDSFIPCLQWKCSHDGQYVDCSDDHFTIFPTTCADGGYRQRDVVCTRRNPQTTILQPREPGACQHLVRPPTQYHTSECNFFWLCPVDSDTDNNGDDSGAALHPCATCNSISCTSSRVEQSPQCYAQFKPPQGSNGGGGSGNGNGNNDNSSSYTSVPDSFCHPSSRPLDVVDVEDCDLSRRCTYAYQYRVVNGFNWMTELDFNRILNQPSANTNVPCLAQDDPSQCTSVYDPDHYEVRCILTENNNVTEMPMESCEAVGTPASFPCSTCGQRCTIYRETSGGFTADDNYRCTAAACFPFASLRAIRRCEHGNYRVVVNSPDDHDCVGVVDDLPPRNCYGAIHLDGDETLSECTYDFPFRHTLGCDVRCIDGVAQPDNVDDPIYTVSGEIMRSCDEFSPSPPARQYTCSGDCSQGVVKRRMFCVNADTGDVAYEITADHQPTVNDLCIGYNYFTEWEQPCISLESYCTFEPACFYSSNNPGDVTIASDDAYLLTPLTTNCQSELQHAMGQYTCGVFQQAHVCAVAGGSTDTIGYVDASYCIDGSLDEDGYPLEPIDGVTIIWPYTPLATTMSQYESYSGCAVRSCSSQSHGILPSPENCTPAVCQHVLDEDSHDQCIEIPVQLETQCINPFTNAILADAHCDHLPELPAIQTCSNYTGCDVVVECRPKNTTSPFSVDNCTKQCDAFDLCGTHPIDYRCFVLVDSIKKSVDCDTIPQDQLPLREPCHNHFGCTAWACTDYRSSATDGQTLTTSQATSQLCNRLTPLVSIDTACSNPCGRGTMERHVVCVSNNQIIPPEQTNADGNPHQCGRQTQVPPRKLVCDVPDNQCQYSVECGVGSAPYSSNLCLWSTTTRTGCLDICPPDGDTSGGQTVVNSYNMPIASRCTVGRAGAVAHSDKCGSDAIQPFMSCDTTPDACCTWTTAPDTSSSSLAPVCPIHTAESTQPPSSTQPAMSRSIVFGNVSFTSFGATGLDITQDLFKRMNWDYTGPAGVMISFYIMHASLEFPRFVTAIPAQALQLIPRYPGSFIIPLSLFSQLNEPLISSVSVLAFIDYQHYDIVNDITLSLPQSAPNNVSSLGFDQGSIEVNISSIDMNGSPSSMSQCGECYNGYCAVDETGVSVCTCYDNFTGPHCEQYAGCDPETSVECEGGHAYPRLLGDTRCTVCHCPNQYANKGDGEGCTHCRLECSTHGHPSSDCARCECNPGYYGRICSCRRVYTTLYYQSPPQIVLDYYAATQQTDDNSDSALQQIQELEVKLNAWKTIAVHELGLDLSLSTSDIGINTFGYDSKNRFAVIFQIQFCEPTNTPPNGDADDEQQASVLSHYKSGNVDDFYTVYLQYKRNLDLYSQSNAVPAAPAALQTLILGSQQQEEQQQQQRTTTEGVLRDIMSLVDNALQWASPTAQEDSTEPQSSYVIDQNTLHAPSSVVLGLTSTLQQGFVSLSELYDLDCHVVTPPRCEFPSQLPHLRDRVHSDGLSTTILIIIIVAICVVCLAVILIILGCCYWKGIFCFKKTTSLKELDTTQGESIDMTTMSSGSVMSTSPTSQTRGKHRDHSRRIRSGTHSSATPSGVTSALAAEDHTVLEDPDLHPSWKKVRGPQGEDMYINYSTMQSSLVRPNADGQLPVTSLFEKSE